MSTFAGMPNLSWRGRIIEALAGSLQRKGFDFARIDVSHAAGDFFVPSGFDRRILRVVQALDEGTSEVSALGDGKREGFFQESRSFLAHAIDCASKKR
jgi:hypothetical protein